MKKFWKKVQLKKFQNTYQIFLDDKILTTPLKKKLVVFNAKIAEELFEEWNQDVNVIDTDDMIFYGILSTSIDKIYNYRKLYIKNILDFIDTDLICYRSEKPDSLVKWQCKNWDPILLKAEKYIKNNIKVNSGIMPLKQDKEIHIRITELLSKLSNLEIIAFHRITNLTGSIFLSLCIYENDLIKKNAFELSYLDELWQAKNWGCENEASTKREKIKYVLNRTIYFLDCLRQ